MLKRRLISRGGSASAPTRAAEGSGRGPLLTFSDEKSSFWTTISRRSQTGWTVWTAYFSDRFSAVKLPFLSQKPAGFVEGVSDQDDSRFDCLQPWTGLGSVNTPWTFCPETLLGINFGADHRREGGDPAINLSLTLSGIVSV